MITITDLTKIYPGGKQALNSLNLQIDKGVFGLVGPNGAGKTTLMRILATLLRPTTGHVRVYGNDLGTPAGKAETRRILGYLPQETSLHLSLTVEQELDYLAILKNITDASERARQIGMVMERVGLSQVRRERIQTLSGGMKRRVGIAIALLGAPRLIIVDEPTAGLDPAERVHFRNVLFELAGDRIVILSTHIIEDVSQICQDLAVIREGHLLFHGSPLELVHRVEGRVWAIPEPEINLARSASIISSRLAEDRIEYRVFSEKPPTRTSRPINPTLEDAYLWLVQQPGTLHQQTDDPL